MNNNNMPLVSAVIPTFNSRDYITDAIKSVLGQTYKNCEIIVIDDGSTDETVEVLKPLFSKIKYCSQGNGGQSTARNTGIRHATGEYIAFLDADDLWLQKKLEKQVAYMEKNKRVGMSFTDSEIFKKDGIVYPSLFSHEKLLGSILPKQAGVVDACFRKLISKNFIRIGSVVIRRDCLEKSGLFDEALRNVPDLDFFLRIAMHYEIACIPEVLERRRLHDKNISADSLMTTRGYLAVLEKFKRLYPDYLASIGIDIDKIIAGSYFSAGYILFGRNKMKDSREHFLKSLRIRYSKRPLIYYLVSFVGNSILNFARQLKSH